MILVLLTISLCSFTWRTDFSRAKSDAAEQHKAILLNFSGSDWCTPCMQLKTEIFDAEIFRDFASRNLELVNADFPRLKKNKLSPELAMQNDSLAAQYNPGGKFPLTILILGNGKVVKTWIGNPGKSPQEFVNQIKSAVDANR
jgi:thioredoxin-related protein